MLKLKCCFVYRDGKMVLGRSFRYVFLVGSLGPFKVIVFYHHHQGKRSSSTVEHIFRFLKPV